MGRRCCKNCVRVMCIFPVRATLCMSCMAFSPVCVFHFFVVVGSSRDFVVYLSPSNNVMGGKTRDQLQGWARKVVNLFRERGSGGERPVILGSVAKVLGAHSALGCTWDGNLHEDLIYRTLGCTWSYSPKPSTPPYVHTNRGMRYQWPRRPMAKRARGSGSTTRFERAIVIRNGFIGILRAP